VSHKKEKRVSRKIKREGPSHLSWRIL